MQTTGSADARTVGRQRLDHVVLADAVRLRAAFGSMRRRRAPRSKYKHGDRATCPSRPSKPSQRWSFGRQRLLPRPLYMLAGVTAERRPLDSIPIDRLPYGLVQRIVSEVSRRPLGRIVPLGTLRIQSSSFIRVCRVHDPRVNDIHHTWCMLASVLPSPSTRTRSCRAPILSSSGVRTTEADDGNPICAKITLDPPHYQCLCGVFKPAPNNLDLPFRV